MTDTINWSAERPGGADPVLTQSAADVILDQIRKAPTAGEYGGDENQHDLVREVCNYLLKQIQARGLSGCRLCQG